ncbi:hypothetical protein CVS40_8289, partial [Lucilia cuprina]
EETQKNTLQNLLTSWGLNHLINFFQEQNITNHALSIMSVNDLFEITQQMKIGDKIIFKYNLQKWRAENNIPIMNQQTLSDSQESKTVSSPFSLSQSSCSEFEFQNSKIIVLDILKQHTSGCNILEYYEKIHLITEEQRSCLINIIVEHFESKNLQMSLQTSYEIERQILQIFQSEKLEYYRTERRGKIYVNSRNFFKYCESRSYNISDLKDTIEPEDDAQLFLQKIKFDNLTADEFNSAWAACVKFRLNQIRNECQNIKEALKLWPQYKGSNGYKFIESDFNAIHKNVPSILSWEDKFLKLYTFLKHHANIKDRSVNKIVATVDKRELEEDKDIFHLKMLWCLHYNLYQTKKFLRKNVYGKREYGKFTIKDSQDSFIYINATMQSLEDHLDFLSAKGDPVQPFILGLGDVETLKINSFYVYLDGQLMPFENF